MVEDGIRSIIHPRTSISLDRTTNRLMGLKIVTATIILQTHLLAGNHLHLELVVLPAVHLHHPLTSITAITTVLLPTAETKDHLRINVRVVSLDMALLLRTMIGDAVMDIEGEDIEKIIYIQFARCMLRIRGRGAFQKLKKRNFSPGIEDVFYHR